MTYTTDGGTQFSVQNGQIMISREDEPHFIIVSVADMEQFFQKFSGYGEADGDDSESS